MTIDWCEVAEGGLRFTLPASLRRDRRGPLFKGRIVKGDPDSELVVVIDPDLDRSTVADVRTAFRRPPPFTEWDGLTFTYHSWGVSDRVPGGLESKLTQTAPNRRGRGHRWGITFPIAGRWAQLDVANGLGGLEWQQFEEIADTIIRSTRAL